MVVVEHYPSAEEGIAYIERVQDKVKMHNEANCLSKVRSGQEYGSVLGRNTVLFWSYNILSWGEIRFCLGEEYGSVLGSYKILS